MPRERAAEKGPERPPAAGPPDGRSLRLSPGARAPPGCRSCAARWRVSASFGRGQGLHGQTLRLAKRGARAPAYHWTVCPSGCPRVRGPHLETFLRGAVALRHQAAAREPAKERTEREPGLRCEGDIGGQSDDSAERQAQHGSEPDGGSNAHRMSLRGQRIPARSRAALRASVGMSGRQGAATREVSRRTGCPSPS
jgi:hypothetical protein